MPPILPPRLRQWVTTPTVISFIISGIIFGTLGWLIPAPSPFSSPRYVGGVLYQTNNAYQYIDPLLACEVGPQSVFTDVAPLKVKLTSMIDADIASGKAEHVSVYFRSLKGAHWFDINPTDQYSPASLLKVFVMMAYYKEVDDANNPDLLLVRVPFSNSFDPTDEPGEQIPHLVAGESYTINELINQMIIYSDNDALATLTEHMDQGGVKALQEIFTDLRINSPLTQNSTYYMPIDQYALAFRVLYGSTYLSRQYSEQALSLLSKAHYTGALVAGVPVGIQVAHKFGVSTGPAYQELHDCGIVYYPQHPYLLCVMTHGTDITKLEGIIKDISAAVYADSAERHPLP